MPSKIKKKKFYNLTFLLFSYIFLDIRRKILINAELYGACSNKIDEIDDEENFNYDEGDYSDQDDDESDMNTTFMSDGSFSFERFYNDE